MSKTITQALREVPTPTPAHALGFPPQSQVGQTVLVNLGDGILRPLLVVEDVGSVVNGWLFCDSHVDSGSLWLRQASGGQPTKYSGPLYLSDLVMGPGVGQWRVR